MSARRAKEAKQILFLLRHAKSSWKQRDLHDHERPLSARGERAAALMAVYWLQQGFSVERVVCSTAQRTRQTLERLLPALRPVPEVRFDRAVYEAPAAQLLERICQHGEGVQSLLLIGHNPGLEELVRELCGAPDGNGQASEPLAGKFATGSLARIELPRLVDAAAGAGALKDFVTPKQLV